MLRQFHTIIQPEPDFRTAFHYDLINQFAEQLLIEILQIFRAILKDSLQRFGLLDDIDFLLFQKYLFLLLGFAKLLCQLIAFGYKNIRVNQPLLVQQAQSVTLT